MTNHSTRIENMARDLAASYAISLEEARAKILSALYGPHPPLAAMADTLASDDPALD